MFLGTSKTLQGVRSRPTQACNVRWVSEASVSGTLVDLFPEGTGELWLVIRQRDDRTDRVRSVTLEAITGLGRPRERGV